MPQPPCCYPAPPDAQAQAHEAQAQAQAQLAQAQTHPERTTGGDGVSARVEGATGAKDLENASMFDTIPLTVDSTVVTMAFANWDP